MAATAICATDSREHEDLLFTREFAGLHAYSAPVYGKFEALVRGGAVGDTTGWKRLWDRCSERFLAAGQDLRRGTIADETVAATMVGVLAGAVALHGEGYKRNWQRFWKATTRLCLPADSYFNINAAFLGCFVNRCDAYVEWLLKPESHDREMTDVVCFVRRDFSTQLFATIGRLVRGERVPPTLALNSGRPSSSLNYVFQYVRTGMRRADYFTNEGFVLGVLTWASAAVVLFEQLKARDISDREVARLEKELLKVRRTATMEKNRYRRVATALPLGRCRSRIEELWLRVAGGGASGNPSSPLLA